MAGEHTCNPIQCNPIQCKNQDTNSTGRLVHSLKLRRHDPAVSALVEDRGGKTLDHKTGVQAQEIVFGSYDFSAYSAQGQYGELGALW